MSTHLRGRQDAFGRALLDHYAGEAGPEITERDDGFIAISAASPAPYFTRCEEWPAHHQWAATQCGARVIDVGCGAGRFALHLQQRSREVLAVDVSAGAVEVCRARGVRDVRQLSLTELTPALGTFDTILMMGNNFGLFATPARARWLLRRFAHITTRDGRIVAEAADPYHTRDPLHLAYHDRNRRRGRMPGQVRMRVRYRDCRTPWFDFLLLSRPELEALLVDTGWHVAEERGSAGPSYVVVLRKTR